MDEPMLRRPGQDLDRSQGGRDDISRMREVDVADTAVPGRAQTEREAAEREEVDEEVRHEMHDRSPEKDPPSASARRMSVALLIGVTLAGTAFLVIAALTIGGWATLFFAGALLVGYVFLAAGLPRLLPDTMRQQEQHEAEEIVIHRHELQEGTARQP